MSYETCVICDCETGRAGRADDSIYETLSKDLPELNLKAGDEIGPLCSDCYVGIYLNSEAAQ